MRKVCTGVPWWQRGVGALVQVMGVSARGVRDAVGKGLGNGFGDVDGGRFLCIADQYVIRLGLSKKGLLYLQSDWRH